MNTIHIFKAEGIEGEVIEFAAFAGKKIIVGYVVSECGFTTHPDDFRGNICKSYSRSLRIK